MISSTPDPPEEGQVIISLICRRKNLCYAPESAFSPGRSPGPQGAAGEAAASQLLEAFNAHALLLGDSTLEREGWLHRSPEVPANPLVIITVWLLFNSSSCHLWDRGLRRILPALKVTGPRDALAEVRGEENRRVLTGRWTGFSASIWQTKSPKVTMDPPQNRNRLTDSSGQGGGNRLILGSQVYKRTPWGGHDRGLVNGWEPPGNPKPRLKGTWKGKGADCMEPAKAVCSSSTIERTTVEDRGDNQPLGYTSCFSIVNT